MKSELPETWTCLQARQALLESFDAGGLGSPLKALASHISHCDSCRLEREKLLTLASGLEQLPVPDPGMNYRINFLPAVRLSLDTRRKTQSRKDLAWAPSLALAVLLAFALVKQPTVMAPPTWYQTQGAKLESTQLIDQEYERLSQALEQRDSLALDLSSKEVDLILKISDDASVTWDDPLAKLSALSDEGVEAVLKKLEESSIRS